MMRTLATFAAAVSIAAAVTTGASGSRTKFGVDETMRDFEEGKLRNLVLASEGDLALEQVRRLLLPTAPNTFIWSIASDSKGTIYAGTSNAGVVLKIADGKRSVFFEATDPAIFAMAVDSDDNLYVGTSPTGKVFKLAPDGKESVYLDTGESYIWAMDFGPGGELYVATGPHGMLFRVEPGKAPSVGADGKPVPYAQSELRHLLALAVDSKGNVYTAGDRSGIVYKTAPAAKPQMRVIYDAPESEVRAIAIDGDDNVYAGTADLVPNQDEARTSLLGRIIGRLMGGGMPNAAPALVGKPAPKDGAELHGADNAIYRIGPDGAVTKVFTAKGFPVLCMTWTPGGLVFGTGNKGRFCRLDGERLYLHAGLGENEVTSVDYVAKTGAIVFGTSNGGRITELGPKFVRQGHYLSDVLDAGMVSRWGSMSWTGRLVRGRTNVVIYTRSGNVSEPDDKTWSPWTAAVYVRPGEYTVKSPDARFLQYSLALAGDGESSPTVQSVKYAYLNVNVPPVFNEIKIGDTVVKGASASPAKKKPGDATSPSASEKPATSVINLTWKATDPNGDDLVYSVDFRRRGDTEWRTIAEKLTETKREWDTASVPDGQYVLRFSASDSPTNPPELAKTAVETTKALVVDNTGPAVLLTASLVEGSAAQVGARIHDTTSAVASADYSLDGGAWVPLGSADGIFGDRDENVLFKITGLEPGRHLLVIRGTDAAGNAGYYKGELHVRAAPEKE